MYGPIVSPITKKKECGIISLYVLASLNKNPQSGYDLLKNIKEKTNGQWVPSKGVVYPLIKQMEKNGLIKIKKKGARSKKIYNLTKNGVNYLNSIRKPDSNAREKVLRVRNLFDEVFGEHFTFYADSIFDIKDLVFTIKPSKKDQVKRILNECASKLKKLK
jgi:DNA-binding PadR family transcriptional regulator